MLEVHECAEAGRGLVVKAWALGHVQHVHVRTAVTQKAEGRGVEAHAADEVDLTKAGQRLGGPAADLHGADEIRPDLCRVEEGPQALVRQSCATSTDRSEFRVSGKFLCIIK